MTAHRVLECEHCRDLGVIVERNGISGNKEVRGCGRCQRSFDPAYDETFKIMVVERLLYLEQQLQSNNAPKRAGTHAPKRKRAKSRGST